MTKQIFCRIKKSWPFWNDIYILLTVEHNNLTGIDSLNFSIKISFPNHVTINKRVFLRLGHKTQQEESYEVEQRAKAKELGEKKSKTG